MYTIDPRMYPHAKRLYEITYNEMMQMACLGAGVLETRSVELASKYGVRLYLGKGTGREFRQRNVYYGKNEASRRYADYRNQHQGRLCNYEGKRSANDGKFLNSLFAMISQLDINLDTYPSS